MSEVIVYNDSDLRQTLKAKEVADFVGPLLASTYPGYRWRVAVKGGMVEIQCEHANSTWGRAQTFGYYLKPELYFSETQWRAAVVKAGGEILERAELSRRRFNPTEWLTRPRDFSGRILMDTR